MSSARKLCSILTIIVRGVQNIIPQIQNFTKIRCLDVAVIHADRHEVYSGCSQLICERTYK